MGRKAQRRKGREIERKRESKTIATKQVQNHVDKVGETPSAIQEGHLDELENREEGELVKAKRGKMRGGESGGRTMFLLCSRSLAQSTVWHGLDGYLI